jgi:hypothetical protein
MHHNTVLTRELQIPPETKYNGCSDIFIALLYKQLQSLISGIFHLRLPNLLPVTYHLKAQNALFRSHLDLKCKVYSVQRPSIDDLLTESGNVNI